MAIESIPKQKDTISIIDTTISIVKTQDLRLPNAITELKIHLNRNFVTLSNLSDCVFFTKLYLTADTSSTPTKLSLANTQNDYVIGLNKIYDKIDAIKKIVLEDSCAVYLPQDVSLKEDSILKNMFEMQQVLQKKTEIINAILIQVIDGFPTLQKKFKNMDSASQVSILKKINSKTEEYKNLLINLDQGIGWTLFALKLKRY